jgi:hypothetical protein
MKDGLLTSKFTSVNVPPLGESLVMGDSREEPAAGHFLNTGRLLQ